MGLTGSKCDLFEKNEKISEEEARNFANENDAVFKLTSAMSGSGIDELFEEIGKKYLSPEFTNSEEIIQRKIRKNEVTKVNKDEEMKNNKAKNKKGCCG